MSLQALCPLSVFSDCRMNNMTGSDITDPRLNCLEEEAFDDHTNLDSSAVFKSTHHRTKLTQVLIPKQTLTSVVTFGRCHDLKCLGFPNTRSEVQTNLWHGFIIRGSSHKLCGTSQPLAQCALGIAVAITHRTKRFLYEDSQCSKCGNASPFHPSSLPPYRAKAIALVSTSPGVL